MASRIPENLLEDVLSRVDIVEIISGYIPMKKAGANFKANCPFLFYGFSATPDLSLFWLR
jgi:hypothetical protein